MSLLSRLLGRHVPEERGLAWHPTPPHAGVSSHERRHIPGVPYILPKDQQEEQRINFQHYLLYHLLGNHFLAPLSWRLDEMLDVGCGNGRWAADMARVFPFVRVVGLDIEPPLHPVSAPPNYEFVQGNLLHGLPFAEKSFDYVHQRFLAAALPVSAWPFVLGELVRVTRPQGWVELVEGGDSYHHAGPLMQQFLAWGKRACLSKEIDVSVVKQLESMAQQAGLQEITQRTFRVPVGAWSGRQGDAFAKNMHAVLVGLKDVYCATISTLTPEQFDTAVAALPDEWERCHTTYELSVIYGQRG